LTSSRIPSNDDGETAVSTSARGDVSKGPSVMLGWIE